MFYCRVCTAKDNMQTCILEKEIKLAYAAENTGSQESTYCDDRFFRSALGFRTKWTTFEL